MRGLKDKVAIVTGGAGRIGRAVAGRLVDEGAQVVIADIDGNAAAEVAAAHGEMALGVAFDAAEEKSIAAMVAATVDRFGGVDILHNNAAFVNLGELGTDTTAIETPLDLWDITMNVNVRGYFIAAREVLPHMIARGGGSIINIASGRGVQGDLGMPAYGASKAGLINLSLNVATQYGKQGIRSNTVIVGMVLTPAVKAAVGQGMIDLFTSHHLTPYVADTQDIAYPIGFLASDQARFITGATLAVDGGMTSHTPPFADMMKVSGDGMINQG